MYDHTEMPCNLNSKGGAETADLGVINCALYRCAKKSIVNPGRGGGGCIKSPEKLLLHNLKPKIEDTEKNGLFQNSR